MYYIQTFQRVLRTGYYFLWAVLTINCNAADNNEKLCKIDLGQGFKLVPYAEHHRKDLAAVVNDPEVYKSIRHGGIWDKDLLDRRHAFYIEKNAAFRRGEPYKPESFPVCWVLEEPSGHVIGRGGLQDSDEYEPTMTEVFFAIVGSHQWKPDSQNKLGLGKKAFKGIINWFHTNIDENIPLR